MEPAMVGNQGNFEWNSQLSTVNTLGYYPVTGQAVAVGRAVYGSLKFAVNIILGVGSLFAALITAPLSAGKAQG